MLIYEGKAKQVFSTDNEEELMIHYKDTATALNGQRKEEISEKGRLNCAITSLIYKMLTDEGVPNHFIEKLNDTDILVRRVKIIPLEIIVRNVAAGSFSKKYGIPEGGALRSPILEYSYKNDALGDPMINDYHILALGIATREELDEIADMAFRVNTLLSLYFGRASIRLVDFKIEIGRDCDGKLLLADEISPDTCRLWDTDGRKLDKDNFRRNLGSLTAAYEEVLSRLESL